MVTIAIIIEVIIIDLYEISKELMLVTLMMLLSVEATMTVQAP